MDRRMQKTRTAIINAFSSLLEQKRYAKITVQDIIDVANIGRSTFYSHFETKDDLLKALCSNIFDHVFEKELSSERSHDFSSASHDFEIQITHILYHLIDDQREIKAILSCESGELFLGMFKSHMETLVSDSISRQNFNTIPKDFIVNHIAGSFLEAVKWWISHDMKETPEVLTDYFFSMIPKYY